MKTLYSGRLCIVVFIYTYFTFSSTLSFSQSFYFGADLSYVNEMEDCGAVYKVNGNATDPYALFKNNGANLIRLRLWHTPSWYDALNQGQRYSDLQDVRLSIIRAKSEGMQVLLDFHLSDTWADPTHQVAPVAWASVLGNLEILQDSLYNYIYSALANLAADDLLPEIVQIGNETNKGILLSQETNDAGWTLDWQRNSTLFNTAITAIRDIEVAFNHEIKIALHIANPNDVGWYMQQFHDHGVTDFEIIGISYYWQYHSVLFSSLGNTITSLKNSYPDKAVMIFETAYPWTTGNADAANNILYTSYPGYSPLSPEHQKQWMIDLTQTVIDHGGTGVIYWEPAWVSTGCSTLYGVGSHWDNATFFDFDDELQIDGGIGWMSHSYNFPTSVKEQPLYTNQMEIYKSGDEIIIRKQDGFNLNGRMEINVYTVDGKKIFSQTESHNWENNIYTVFIPSISTGIYLVTILTGEEVISGRLYYLN